MKLAFTVKKNHINFKHQSLITCKNKKVEKSTLWLQRELCEMGWVCRLRVSNKNMLELEISEKTASFSFNPKDSRLHDQQWTKNLTKPQIAEVHRWSLDKNDLIYLVLHYYDYSIYCTVCIIVYSLSLRARDFGCWATQQRLEEGTVMCVVQVNGIKWHHVCTIYSVV